MFFLFSYKQKTAYFLEFQKPRTFRTISQYCFLWRFFSTWIIKWGWLRQSQDTAPLDIIFRNYDKIPNRKMENRKHEMENILHYF